MLKIRVEEKTRRKPRNQIEDRHDGAKHVPSGPVLGGQGVTYMGDPEDVVNNGENVDNEGHQGGLHLVGPGNAHHEAEEEHEVDKHRALTNVG